MDKNTKKLPGKDYLGSEYQVNLSGIIYHVRLSGKNLHRNYWNFSQVTSSGNTNLPDTLT